MTRIMNVPRSLDLAITNRCNQRCRYCSHFTSAGDVGHDLPTDDWIRFFEEMGRYAIMDVTIEGGEAFIHNDLPVLIDSIVENRMRFNILSNGTLITDEIASHLASTGRCDGVQISIDGSTAEVHDSCRGKGTFEKMLKGLENLRANNIPIPVRVTLHHLNVHDLDNISAFILDELGLNSFSTNSASFMGLCRQNSDDVQLTVEDRIYAMETLLRLNKEYNGRTSAAAGPLAEAEMWLDMEDQRKNGAEGFVNGLGYLTSCGGPFSKIAVRADGAFVPCLQLPHMNLGTINRDDLKTVWQEHPELRRLRERRTIPLSQFDYCKDCPYLPYCRGGCPALSYTYTGEVYGPNTDICLRKFLEDGGRLPEVHA